ncbi:MAG: hypothetical protein K2H50_01645 [Paramuribaculum sp.]|nr:hypothetical protein [Paramuribaculum sp.]MDE5835692.1 hypothetical protein [Paramuribaculum sp.]
MNSFARPKIVEVVTDKIKKADNGSLFFSNSFPEYGDEYIGHIMSDLVKSGELFRIGRGVYLKTTSTRFGLVYPSVDIIAKSIAERDNAEVLPTGAMALNILGLSTQVPMNPTFITSGSARIINIGGRNITFKRAVPRNFAIKGKKRRLIVQALKAIGEKNMTTEDSEKIGVLIKKYPEPENFGSDLKAMPTWIRRIFLKYSVHESN